MLAVEFALVVLVFALLVEPVLVALHELGHALVPLVLGHETAVFVGGDRGPTISLGALTVTVAPRGFVRPSTQGATVTDVQSGRWTVFAGTLGGPLTSLLATLGGLVALQFVTAAWQWWLLLFAIGYATLQTVSTLVPFRGPADPESGERFKTDGRIALELLLGRDPVLDGEHVPFASDGE